MSKQQTEKTSLHPRNLHRSRYDFELLTKEFPELKKYIGVNEHGVETIDFSEPKAVKALNNALLITYYGIKNWGIPDNYLCPPIPGRADYIHTVADILASCNNGKIPEGSSVFGLDVGVGANCIYPILGNAIYGWSFVGSEIDEKAIENCTKIIESNPKLIETISLQQQVEPYFIFKNIIAPDDRFDFVLCNPPFHTSQEEATRGTIRKIKNLENKKTTQPVLNFGGQNAELWCEGGEFRFISQMIYESAKYPMQCLWFTTLVAKQSHLKSLYRILNEVNVVSVKTINMAQGQKTSRVLAWTFLSEQQQEEWNFEEIHQQVY